jgi:hypothetical protein
VLPPDPNLVTRGSPLAPVIAMAALARALRHAGAAADVGAALEAVPGADSRGGGAANSEFWPEGHLGTASAAAP